MYILQLYSDQNKLARDFTYRTERIKNGTSAIDNVKIVHYDMIEIGDLSCLVDAPVLIIHNLSDPDLLPVVRKRKARRLQTIYELSDNFMYSNAHRAEAAITGVPDEHITILELLKLCEVVIVNNEKLAALVRPLASHTVVLPDYIKASRFGELKRENSQTFTVGWSGSTRDLPEFQQIAPSLKKWLARSRNVKFIVMGPRACLDLLKGFPKDKIDFRPQGSYSQYLTFMDELVVGLAPLLENEFNRCRSDIKMLEYASRGVIPICQNFGSYASSGVEMEWLPLFNAANELPGLLANLRDNRAAAAQLAEKAFKMTKKHHEESLEEWRLFFEQYAKAGAVRVERRKGSTSQKCRGDQSVASQINAAINTSEEDQTLRQIKTVISRSMNNYQTHYYYARSLSRSKCYEEAITQLKIAVQANPESVRSWQLMSRIYLTLTQTGEALAAIDAALQLEPELATSIQLKAQVLHAMGRHRVVYRLLKEVIARQPNYIEAKIDFVRAAIILDEFFEAERTILHLRRIVPENAEALYLYANLSRKRGENARAKEYLQDALKKSLPEEMRLEIQEELNDLENARKRA